MMLSLSYPNCEVLNFCEGTANPTKNSLGIFENIVTHTSSSQLGCISQRLN